MPPRFHGPGRAPAHGTIRPAGQQERRPARHRRHPAGRRSGRARQHAPDPGRGDDARPGRGSRRRGRVDRRPTPSGSMPARPSPSPSIPSSAPGSGPRSCSPGPLLARFGKVTLPPPGGDVIGRRRVDTHFLALEQLGASLRRRRPATRSRPSSSTAPRSSSTSRASPAPRTRSWRRWRPGVGPCCGTPPPSPMCRMWPACWSRWAPRSKASAPTSTPSRAGLPLQGTQLQPSGPITSRSPASSGWPRSPTGT